MKRIPTLIVTLVCVFAAYSQNTVYIWKGNTLSVQAADSLTIDRSTSNLVDLGLSVMWARADASSGCKYSDANTAVMKQSSHYRLPTYEEYRELAKQCTITIQPDNGLNFIAPNGNSISLRVYKRISLDANIGAGVGYQIRYWFSKNDDNYAAMFFGAEIYESQATYNYFGMQSTTLSYPVRAVCSY